MATCNATPTNWAASGVHLWAISPFSSSWKVLVWDYLNSHCIFSISGSSVPDLLLVDQFQEFQFLHHCCLAPLLMIQHPHSCPLSIYLYFKKKGEDKVNCSPPCCLISIISSSLTIIAKLKLFKKIHVDKLFFQWWILQQQLLRLSRRLIRFG